ncbi:flagellar hook assembly protein FlgD [Donghicola sp. C2-DW-16]|uniref:Basal-body rod modification protein FlgD n=1 Tax=Donghicola mangrovi TaxID=2729614 RepID=A0ABX2P9C2_9RHOB|nr:flagellar hook capping FlgD N-terminal domain-containing protein [Donghicola mangrovi]NVO25953.1 flagellar hook assembly protein FlgD [Donghicola mangrovi]
MAVSSVSSSMASQAASSSSPKAASVLSSDFETFLKMMTVQMQNQDPLNPVESTDFAVQLATFSQVEQQVLTNQYLESLCSTSGTSGLAAQAQLLGRFVLSSAATDYSGGTIEISPEYSGAADQHILVIRDADGTEVGRRELSGTPETILWSGATDAGETLDQGSYSFSIESYSDGALSATSSARTWTEVTQVRIGDAGAELTLASGATVYETEVDAIR